MQKQRVELAQCNEKDFDKRFNGYLKNKKKMNEFEKDKAHSAKPDFEVY